MKKNTMMRVASALLIAVLLTTSVISGTYAKYVTRDTANDQARVAKFGVVLDVEGKLFEDSYLKADGNTPGTASDTGAAITVLSSTNVNAADFLGAHDKDLVVAPGTKNDKGFTFSIKGTPEVAVAVELKLQKAENNDAEPDAIFLKKGFYRDWTDGTAALGNDYGKAFELTADYYPIVFTLKETAGAEAFNCVGAAQTLTSGMSTSWSVDGTAGKGGGATITGTLADMQKLFNALNTAFEGSQYPNYVFDNTFVLTWEWAFETGANDTEKAMYNKADTLLGDLMANPNVIPADDPSATAVALNTISRANEVADPTFSSLTAGTEYNLETGFYFEISVTQVD